MSGSNENRNRGEQPPADAAGAFAVEMPAGLSTEESERLLRFATTDEAILLLGEPGTGKTFLAEWIHRASRRARGPFLRVNLAGLDDSIASSELFGYVPGAYTDARGTRAGAFSSAHHGTIFLDEIGKSSHVVQRKLLDVLERHVIKPLGSDREVRVDTRMIFAANESLEALVSSGEMLRDFLPRLGMFRVTLLPLRERRSEIPQLLRILIQRHAPKFGWSDAAPPEVSKELDETLTRCDWPDNARELEALVRRLLADSVGSREITPALLVGDLAAYAGELDDSRSARAALSRAVGEAIARNRGNKSRAARELGIARSTLYLAAADPSAKARPSP